MATKSGGHKLCKPPKAEKAGEGEGDPNSYRLRATPPGAFRGDEPPASGTLQEVQERRLVDAGAGSGPGE